MFAAKPTYIRNDTHLAHQPLSLTANSHKTYSIHASQAYTRAHKMQPYSQSDYFPEDEGAALPGYDRRPQHIDYGFNEAADVGRQPGVSGIGGSSPLGSMLDGFRSHAEQYGPTTLDGFGPSPQEDLRDLEGKGI